MYFSTSLLARTGSNFASAPLHGFVMRSQRPGGWPPGGRRKPSLESQPRRRRLGRSCGCAEWSRLAPSQAQNFAAPQPLFLAVSQSSALLARDERSGSSRSGSSARLHQTTHLESGSPGCDSPCALVQRDGGQGSRRGSARACGAHAGGRGRPRRHTSLGSRRCSGGGRAAHGARQGRGSSCL
jgi:hypothetical protein